MTVDLVRYVIWAELCWRIIRASNPDTKAPFVVDFAHPPVDTLSMWEELIRRAWKRGRCGRTLRPSMSRRHAGQKLSNPLADTGKNPQEEHICVLRRTASRFRMVRRGEAGNPRLSMPPAWAVNASMIRLLVCAQHAFAVSRDMLIHVASSTSSCVAQTMSHLAYADKGR